MTGTRFLKLVTAATIPALLGGCTVEVAHPRHEVVVEQEPAPDVEEHAGDVVVEEEPPAPRHETVIIEQRPGPDFVWIGGHWGRTGHGWIWINGHWTRSPYGPGWVWMGGRWVHRNGRWHWQAGAWVRA